MTIKLFDQQVKVSEAEAEKAQELLKNGESYDDYHIAETGMVLIQLRVLEDLNELDIIIWSGVEESHNLPPWDHQFGAVVDGFDLYQFCSEEQKQYLGLMGYVK